MFDSTVVSVVLIVFLLASLQRGRAERAAERRGGQVYRRARRFGVPQCGQHHEVVHRAVETDARRWHVGVAEFGRVRLALVSENVVLVDDDQSGWQAFELVEPRSQRGDGALDTKVLLRKVRVPEPL